MMRITTLVFVCASIAGCSWGGSGDGGSGGSGPDASVSSAPVCGDKVCASSEVGSCASDCGSGGSNNPQIICGNGTCETGETSASCPNDCGGGGGGSGAGTCPANVQDCAACAIFGQLCPPGLDKSACAACITGGGGGLGMCNNDGTCDPAEMGNPACADCP